MRILVEHGFMFVLWLNWTLGHLMRNALESVSLELRTLLGEAFLLAEMSDALLSSKDLFLRHALQSLLPVLVHVNLELLKKVLGLYVRAVFVKNVPVLDIRLAQDGVLMCLDRWKVVILL